MLYIMTVTANPFYLKWPVVIMMMGLKKCFCFASLTFNWFFNFSFLKSFMGRLPCSHLKSDPWTKAFFRANKCASLGFALISHVSIYFFIAKFTIKPRPSFSAFVPTLIRTIKSLMFGFKNSTLGSVNFRLANVTFQPFAAF